MATLTDMREKQAKLVADARAKLDEITDDTDESRAKEIEAEYDRIMADYDKLDARAKREEELAEREAAMNAPDPRRPNGADTRVDPNKPEKQVTYDDAFVSYLRNGLEGLTAEERTVLRAGRNTDFAESRAQSTTTTAGGYTIPEGFSNELVKSMKAWGPMLDPGVTRELVTASGNNIPWPTLDDTSNTGYRLDENTEASNEGDLTFGQKMLGAFKYASGPILVSSELIQDSAFNIETVVRDAMAERIARKVNSDLTIGDGTGDPNGIVTASTAGFTATSADAIAFDDLIELVHSVDPAYRTDPSVRLMFNDTTLKLLRKIKDSDNNYIWQPASVQTGAPARILDYSYSINQAMANVADSQKSVLFGVFNKYIVRRVREFAVRRLMERYAEFDQVGFIGFARYDGELLDTAAVKHLAHPATN